MIWGCSSVGRASALHADGQEFESPRLHFNIQGAVTEWFKVAVLKTAVVNSNREFESHRLRHFI